MNMKKYILASALVLGSIAHPTVCKNDERWNDFKIVCLGTAGLLTGAGALIALYTGQSSIMFGGTTLALVGGLVSGLSVRDVLTLVIVPGGTLFLVGLSDPFARYVLLARISEALSRKGSR